MSDPQPVLVIVLPKDARADCWQRPDLGQGQMILHMATTQGTVLSVQMTGMTAVELYVELRRFLGELGGYGPSCDEAKRAAERAERPVPRAANN